MIDKIKKYIKNNPEKVLFIFSFIYLLFLGISLSYNYDIKNNANLIFDSDTSRVILDATEIVANHYRISVHPLFVLLVQPLCYFINGIVLNKMLSIIIISSLVSSLSVLFIYKILTKIKKDDKTNILISLIYLFSFSNIIFTASIETYNFAVLFLIILFYYYVSKTDKLNIYSYIILVLLGILSCAFTITNIIIFLIIIFILFLDKKINIKNSIITLLIIGVSVISLSIFQKLVWNTPAIWNLNISDETTEYAEKTIKISNIKNVIDNDYYNSLVSSNIYMNVKYGNTFNNQNYIISFEKVNIMSIILLSLFYLSTIVLLIRNYKKNVLLNIGLLLSLGFNTCLHIIYGNDSTFLYSLHFLYLIVLLFGTNYLLEENKKIKKVFNIFLPIILIIELIINNTIFIKVLSYVNENINKNIILGNLGITKTLLLELLIIFIIGIIIYIITYLYRIIKKEKNKEKKIILSVSLVCLLILIESIFIGINNIESSKKFIKYNLDETKQVVVPKDKLYYSSLKFKKEFKSELESLQEYEQELKELKSTYSTQDKKNLNWSTYYYFGMANRKKFIYRNNRLIEIDSKKVIKEFEEKDHYIIPNIHTVIIETTDGKFIKIMEDEEGIHYIVNGKDELLDNTKIELYSFENQKYQNIKKVLYGDLLFNIKDGVIYPNIIVYNKTWYRDAALTCMVLKQTNDTNLISDWVNNITEIYDLQNDGNKEPDNLGELLYILSTQENKNEELINKIEEEAERLSNENPNGYYIYGKTDFGDQYLYQNLWYKLGIESIGKKYKFDLSTIPEDNYSKMAWWSNYELKDKSPYQLSEEYPYLSYAANHKMHNSTIPMNENSYPLSWESYASQANYDNYFEIDRIMNYSKISPLHSWSASELLLWLLDETGDLNFK